MKVGAELGTSILQEGAEDGSEEGTADGSIEGKVEGAVSMIPERVRY